MTAQSTMRQRTVLAAAVSLLSACGGGTSSTSDAGFTFKAGDTYTVEVSTPGGATPLQSHSYRMHAVSSKGELMEEASADAIPGALVPLRLPNLAKASSGTEAASPTLIELRSFYKAMVDAKAQQLARMPTPAILETIEDLDGDIATLYADQQRSGLDIPAFLAFYDALNQHPWFAAQEDAEGQLRAFFDDANNELQGAICSTSQGSFRGWSGSGLPCRQDVPTKSLATDAPIPVWNQMALLNALRPPAGPAALLNTMAAQGINFRDLTPIFYAWRLANPSHVSIQDFVDYFMASTPASRALTAKNTLAKNTPNNSPLCALDSSGEGAIAQLVLMQNNRILPHADGTWTCLVSYLDRDPSHYAGAQIARGPSVVFSFKSGSALWSQITVTPRVHYDGKSPASPHRWLPRITADTEANLLTPSLSLTSTLSVSPTQAYEHLKPAPNPGVWLETQVFQVLPSVLNEPRQSHRIHFNAGTGFTR